MIWLIIILMTIIIFISRYIFLAPKLPLKLNSETQRFLSYSSSSVLTAIWAPIVFFHKEKVDLSLNNPYFLSALVALIIAWKTRNVLLTAVVSMFFFFLIKSLIVM